MSNEPIDIVSIYEKVLTNTLRRFPPETWNPYKSGYDNAKRALRYLILEKLKWDRETFCKNINLNIIHTYKLRGAFQGLYDNNIFPFISNAFPDWELSPWELKGSRVPAEFWTPETTAESIRWMIEKQMTWDYETTLENLSLQTFKVNNLEGMLQAHFSHSPYLAIKHAYPEKDWEHLQERKGHKLTNEQVVEIIRLKNEGVKQNKIAKQFNLSPANVSLIVNGKLRLIDEGN